METIKKIVVILILTILCFAGCGENPIQTTGNLTDNPNPSISLKINNGTIETYEYLSLEYSSRRNVLFIETSNGIISKPFENFNGFSTTETNQDIIINSVNVGDTLIKYTSLYYNDRNIFTINSFGNSFYYGIGQLNNFKTNE